jgi:hypothetical protein
MLNYGIIVVKYEMCGGKNMEDKILKATHQGKINIGDKELNCAVLEDGTRVLSTAAIFKAFNRPRKGKGKEEYRVTEMPSFIDANNLQPYVHKALGDGTDFSVKYISNGRELSGYKAEIVPLLCEIYLSAREEGKLTVSQMPLAVASEILVRSLSKLGIIALIDEATGYQADRDRDELQTILSKYISEEYLSWTKTFPDEFYIQMFRLKNWEYKGKPKPPIVGTYTNKLVYEQLPATVLEELKSKSPKVNNYRRHRLFQFLTQHTGIPHLDKHLVAVITLMKSCDTWDEFMVRFEKVFGKEVV